MKTVVVAKFYLEALGAHGILATPTVFFIFEALKQKVISSLWKKQI